MSKGFYESRSKPDPARPKRARQLPLAVCNRCASATRLRWVTAVCQCQWGEDRAQRQREHARELGLVTSLPPGTHAHGAWLCVKCRQRAFDWSDVAIVTSPSLGVLPSDARAYSHQERGAAK